MSALKSKAPICKIVCFNKGKIDALQECLPGSDELEQAAGCYKAMGHPARLAILHLLQDEECCVCDLANILDQPVSTVSQHLKTLKTVGLLRSRQEGKLVFYSLGMSGILTNLGIGRLVVEGVAG